MQAPQAPQASPRGSYGVEPCGAPGLEDGRLGTYRSVVRLLSRYLTRQLAAPFVFALVAQTSLMLLSQIAKKFGALVGKGLSWTVITEVFVLSLPFIVAMTLPMAVLLAVLYTFSHLAADNEITAMRASGLSIYQVLTPVLL